MSLEAVLQVLGRALTDAPFRAKMLSNPQGLIGQYPLTGDELASIKSITPGQLDQIAQAFGQSGMGQDEMFKFFQSQGAGGDELFKFFQSQGVGGDELFKFFQSQGVGDAEMVKLTKGGLGGPDTIPPGPPVVPDNLKPPGPPTKPPGPPVRWLIPGVLVVIIAVLLLFMPASSPCPDGSKPGAAQAGSSGLIGLLDTLRGALGQKPLSPMSVECGQGNASAPPVVVPVNKALIPPTPTVGCIPYETWSGGGPQGFYVPPGVCTPIPTTATQPASHPTVEPPACVPVPGDGLCSACENTDLDSASCVCNMNGVCDPQEGLNCGDCMPTSTGPDKPGKGKPTCTDPAGCP